MSTEARLILFAIAAPAAVAFAVAGLWQRLLPGDYFRRLALPVAVAMGFVAEMIAASVSRHRDEFSIAEYTSPREKSTPPTAATTPRNPAASEHEAQ